MATAVLMDNESTMLPMSTSEPVGNDHYHLNVLAITITLASLMALTLFGNLLVLFAFYAQQQLRKVIYYPIISLALADVLCALTAMPLYILKKNVIATTDERLVCDLYRFTYFFTEYASILSLTAISIERFLVIHNPFKYRTIISPRVMTAALIVCWLEATLVSSMPFYWRRDPNDHCTNSPTKAWSFMVISVNVFLPFLVMLVCHCYIYHKSLKEFGNNSTNNQSFVTKRVSREENWKMERKATLSFTVVIGVFVICWGPSTFYYFVRNVCPECFTASFEPWEDTVSATVKILTFANSFMNPIIYFWLNMDFRKAFIRVLKREWESKNAVPNRSRSNTVNSQNLGVGNVITHV